MDIVVLDSYTLNPDDLSWAGLQRLGTCRIYDRTPAEKVIERAKDAEILIINKIVISKRVIAQLPKLHYIGLCSTGYNVVDTEAAAHQKIAVTNVPAYSTDSVAQLVFAHLLNLCQHVSEHSESVKRGDWTNAPDFCYWNFPLIELDGLTMGIIGMGQIGQAVARIAQQFGMKIFYHDLKTLSDIEKDYRSVDLDTIFRESDVVMLHCPLTPETSQLVNAERLSRMKSSAFLINTSRGQLIDEDALAEALNHEKIAGAGLDVLSDEPPRPDNPLLTAKNCYITPHIAWATRAARQRLMNAVVNNLRAFLKGKPINLVR
jgi:glycerate dehydrogenase